MPIDCRADDVYSIHQPHEQLPRRVMTPEDVRLAVAVEITDLLDLPTQVRDRPDGVDSRSMLNPSIRYMNSWPVVS